MFRRISTFVSRDFLRRSLGKKVPTGGAKHLDKNYGNSPVNFLPDASPFKPWKNLIRPETANRFIDHYFRRNTMSHRVKEILSWYGSDNPGALTNLSRLLNHGKLAGTGKLVILPVDQGFEHGPARSFAPNAPTYDPRYHFELAIAAGCNAYAAPLGFLEAGAREFAGEIPLILKANDHDLLLDEADPTQALTRSIGDALQLGCVGIGFTIYPGSAHRLKMYEQIRACSEAAKRHGLVVMIWSYARGSGLSKTGETAIDVIGYAAQIAAQLGAHIIKVKLPNEHIEQAAAQKVYEQAKIPIATLTERVQHVVQCAFSGRRIMIFSGGPIDSDEAFFNEVRAIHAGHGLGSVVGRNSFQRSKPEALQFFHTVFERVVKHRKH
jgi:class I fructose-bisphosphate aldolase